jgi:hypothetical protein
LCFISLYDYKCSPLGYSTIYKDWVLVKHLLQVEPIVSSLKVQAYMTRFGRIDYLSDSHIIAYQVFLLLLWLGLVGGSCPDIKEDIVGSFLNMIIAGQVKQQAGR